MPVIRCLLCLSALFYSAAVSAQTHGFRVDRPYQTDGVFVVPKNKFQIENGVTFGEKTLLDDLMFRYGLTGSTELRLSGSAGKYEKQSGLLPVSFSAKQRIIQQAGVVPAITAVGYLTVNNTDIPSSYKNETSGELELAFENQLSDKFVVDYNLATTTFDNLIYAASIGYFPIDQLGAFVEYFSKVEQTSNPSHNYDGGIMYFPNDHWSFDFALGNTLIHKQESLYYSLGFSYLF